MRGRPPLNKNRPSDPNLRVYIDIDLKDRFVEYAKNKGISLSDLIELMIETELADSNELEPCPLRD